MELDRKYKLWEIIEGDLSLLPPLLGYDVHTKSTDEESQDLWKYRYKLATYLYESDKLDSHLIKANGFRTNLSGLIDGYLDILLKEDNEPLKHEMFEYLSKLHLLDPLFMCIRDSPKLIILIQEYFEYVYINNILTPEHIVQLYKDRKMTYKMEVSILSNFVGKCVANGNTDKIYNLIDVIYSHIEDECPDGRSTYANADTSVCAGDKGKYFNCYRLVFPHGDDDMIRYAIDKMTEYPPNELKGNSNHMMICIIVAAHKYDRLSDILRILGKKGHSMLDLIGLFFIDESALPFMLLLSSHLDTIINKLAECVELWQIREKYGDNIYFQQWYKKVATDGV